MKHLSFSDDEFNLLKIWVTDALADPMTGSDEYEDTLNSLSEKFLWSDEP